MILKLIVSIYNKIQVRDSKFGPALVIIVSEQSGGYLLGFRIDPEDRLGAVYKELISLHSVYSQNPIFGVEYSLKDQVKYNVYLNNI